jgi:hypothetical protein
MATTSLPLATAAAVATILSGPAGVASADPSNVPTTPAQPGTTDNGGGNPNTAPQQGTPGQSKPGQTNPGQSNPGQSNPGQSNPGQSNPGQTNPGQTGPGQTKPGQPNNAAPQPGTQSEPGVGTPQPGVTTPQPGVTSPPGQGNQGPALAGPTQPGVTTPRVAPLPVPGEENEGQAGSVQPAGVPGQSTPNGTQPGTLQPTPPQDQGVNTPSGPGTSTNPAAPSGSTPQSQGGSQDQGGSTQSLSGNHGTQQNQPHWSAPSLDTAPAAPVVTMTGPHTEVGANVDGGTLLPGYVANTHHFSNLDGYVGTIGYNTPTGAGDAGVSVEFIEANKIKITGYSHATGTNDAKSVGYIDTTQANAAKAAVEGWIREQPGGAAALDAAGRVGRLTQSELAPQTIHVAGVTTQWGGSVQ